jgi:hypothetical protein
VSALRCVAIAKRKTADYCVTEKKCLVVKPRDDAFFLLRSVDCFSVICNMLQEKNEVRVNTNFSSQFDSLRLYDMNGRSQMQGGKN